MASVCVTTERDLRQVERMMEQRQTVAELQHVCSELGWGFAGAEVTEAADIAKGARKAIKAGVEGVWGLVIQSLKGSYAGADALPYLLQNLAVYTKGIELGHYVDMDRKSGRKADTTFIRTAFHELVDEAKRLGEPVDLSKYFKQVPEDPRKAACQAAPEDLSALKAPAGGRKARAH